MFECARMCVDVWQYLFMHRHQKLKLGLPQLWCLYLIYLFTYLCAVCVQDACVWARMLQGMCVGTYVAVHVYRAEDNFVEFISPSIFTWLQESSSGCQLCAAKVFYYLYFSWGSLLSMKLWLAWSLLCKSGWHWTHKKSYLWPPCAGIKSLCPPYVAWPYFLKTGFPIKSWRLLLD